ncbi:MAG: ABC transporter permease [Clostridiaceae bacterium]
MRIIRKFLEIGILSWIVLLVIWQISAFLYGKADFVPGPIDIVAGLKELLQDGSLIKFILVSFQRVLIGWILGSIIAIPIGLLVGRIKGVREFVEPFLNFFRFIPAIAFLTLFLLWFGIGEVGKVVLIMYATIFIVLLNTATGVINVEEEKIRAARSLGASEFQILINVIIPASVPYIFNGVRLAMGNSFMAIVGAEMIAAKEGIGYLIWTSRLYFKTDWIFVGLISLGLMGFFTDKLLRYISAIVLKRYGIKDEGRFKKSPQVSN